MVLVSYEEYGSFEGARQEVLRLVSLGLHSIFGCDCRGFWLRKP